MQENGINRIYFGVANARICQSVCIFLKQIFCYNLNIIQFMMSIFVKFSLLLSVNKYLNQMHIDRLFRAKSAKFFFSFFGLRILHFEKVKGT